MANQRRIRTDLLVSGNAAVTGNTSLTGTLAVTGVTTLGTVAGNTIFSGANVTFQNDVTINDDLVVTGDLTVSGSFSFAGGSVFPDNTFAVQDNVDATKEMQISLGGATTGTVASLVFAQTASRNYTFPDAAMTVVGHDTTQTLTNKTIDADLNTITNIEDADIKSGAAIARSKLAAGSNNHVIINDGSGVLNSEAQLATSRGGTGQDFSASTGVIKVAAGAMSAATIVNADVDAAAAIARSKLASGSNNHVLINDGSGVMSSEAALDETRGGTAQTSFASGDILYASGADTLAKRTIGAAGKTLKVNNSLLPDWEDPTDPARELRIIEDWLTNAAGNTNWTQIAGGAGAASATTLAYNDSNTHGVVEFNSGTSATGFIHRTLGGVTTGAFTSGMRAGGGAITMEFMVYIPVLSDGTQEFSFQMGLKEAYVSSTDHIVCTYNRAAYGTNWQLITRSASTDTIVNSGVAVAAATWVKVRIEVNAAGSSVDLYLDDVLVANSATNIPTVDIAPILSLIKSVGTTARTVAVDYAKIYKRYTTAK